MRRICLLAALPPKVGRQTAMRRPAAQPEWRFNASCLVKCSAACTHPTGTVLAVPQIRVRPRSNSRSPRVRIEMHAAGVAGAEEHRRHRDAKANRTRPNASKATGPCNHRPGRLRRSPATSPRSLPGVTSRAWRSHVCLSLSAAVTLGSIFCVSGHWWGTLLFVPAALNLWFAYLMPSWKRALDAETPTPNRTDRTPARRRDHATTDQASSVDRPQHLHGVCASAMSRAWRSHVCLSLSQR